jgi:hypothetical protein
MVATATKASRHGNWLSVWSTSPCDVHPCHHHVRNGDVTHPVGPVHVASSLMPCQPSSAVRHAQYGSPAPHIFTYYRPTNTPHVRSTTIHHAAKLPKMQDSGVCPLARHVWQLGKFDNSNSHIRMTYHCPCHNDYNHTTSEHSTEVAEHNTCKDGRRARQAEVGAGHDARG